MLYSQVVLLYVIDGFSSARLSLDVDCVVVGCNIENVTREVCSKVCKKVGSTDACAGDFASLQTSWCEHINMRMQGCTC